MSARDADGKSSFVSMPFCKIIAKVLIFLMIFQVWPSVDLTQLFQDDHRASSTPTRISSFGVMEANAGTVTIFGPKKYLRTTAEATGRS
ncbi:MAG: hypothetical protein AB1480_11630 [Nitrospirota bacterium]